MEFQWNTGRLYQADGQRIKAIQLDTGEVVFADMSRGIAGICAKPKFDDVSTLEGMRDYVMFRYDRNEYTDRDSIAWKFLMQGR